MRKPPIRHSVKRYKRQGRWVESFERGRGRKPQRSSKVVGSVRKSPEIHGFIGDGQLGEVVGGPHINDMRIDGERVLGISLDLRNNVILLMSSGAHEDSEVAYGYSGVPTNESRLVRLTRKLGDVYRVYSHGKFGAYGMSGIDVYPRHSASGLRKLLLYGLLNRGDRVCIYFDESLRPSVLGRPMLITEAIHTLEDV